MALLEAFLRDLARKPFSWADLNCGLPLADWWMVNHGVDPAAHLRGVSPTAETCRDLLMRERGLLRLVWTIARAAGARRVADPEPGAIAVVRFQRRHFGAIRTPSGRWAIKATNGLVVTSDCRAVMAWSV